MTSYQNGITVLSRLLNLFLFYSLEIFKPNLERVELQNNVV